MYNPVLDNAKTVLPNDKHIDKEHIDKEKSPKVKQTPSKIEQGWETTLSDVGNAERLVKRHGDKIRYCSSLGKWFIWNRKIWEKDNSGKIISHAIETARSIYQEARRATNLDDQAKASKHALKSQKRPRLEAMVYLAQHMVPVSQDELDSDPWLLNVENGTVDLKTGNLLPHDPEKLITKICNTELNPDAKCPLWMDFLSKIMDGNQTLVDFLQRVFGYSLTGVTSEQCLFILYGTGRNGKSTLLEVFKTLLNDYSKKAEMQSFLAKRDGGINNDIAGLAGARMVSAVEVSQGKSLNESLIKEITGQDTVTARFLYREYFEFIPQFKILLAVNSKPDIHGIDEGIWRRIKLILFGVKIPQSEVDKNLLEKLKRELSGILNWAITGCLDWQKSGLGEPKEVEAATGDYRHEMDEFADFIESRLETAESLAVPESSLWVKSVQIFNEFNNWANENGVEEMTKKKLGAVMGEHGFKTKQKRVDGSNCRVYMGVGIKIQSKMTFEEDGNVTRNGCNSKREELSHDQLHEGDFAETSDTSATCYVDKKLTGKPASGVVGEDHAWEGKV
jgi:putative DNA primase/helicase